MVQGFTKQLIRLLESHGWRYARPGKGDHQIWNHADQAKAIVVDNKIMSRHTANAVLKQAGIKAKF